MAEKKIKSVSISLTLEQFKRIQTEAEKLGLDNSAFIRMVVFKHLNSEK